MDTLDQAYAPVAAYKFPVTREIERSTNPRIANLGPVVSADSHYTVGRNIWFEGFPDHLKDKAPHIWFENGVYQIGFNGKTLFPEYAQANLRSYDGLKGASQIEARLRDLDAEGIDKELIFANGVLALLHHPDFELREWVYNIYNEHLLEVAGQSNGRFVGVALPNFWDKTAYRTTFERIARHFKTFMLPLKPGKSPDGAEINYADDTMDEMWSVIEDTGLPVSFHIGENFAYGRGALATSALINFSPFRQVMGQLVFGGILDRHPKLKIVFAEAGLNWVPGTIQDMEAICRSHGTMFDWTLRHSPQYYWDNHCYATFMSDPLGLGMIDKIGVERSLWSSDYPHAESTFGYIWRAKEELVAAVGLESARKMLGGNAVSVFKL